MTKWSGRTSMRSTYSVMNSFTSVESLSLSTDRMTQSFRTVEGEVLTLLRVLDPKMTEIYG
jgi:hypothetical protein